jgi:hypothetical protein
VSWRDTPYLLSLVAGLISVKVIHWTCLVYEQDLWVKVNETRLRRKQATLNSASRVPTSNTPKRRTVAVGKA